MPSADPAAIAVPPVSPLPDDRRRYPGVRSFEEPDQMRFFGRTDSTDELLLRVLSVRLLLQFAPSGVGKTSLLNAGLFPKLRQHTCFPFIIRLNRDNETLTQAATRSLRDAAAASGLKEPVIPENAENLWALLSGLQLWSSDLLLLTPVLVFDQFEEIFTLRDEAFRKNFASEVGELLRRRTGLSIAQPSEASPDVKIVISLREEYLGKLEELSASIPDLFHERLRLSALSANEAKEAIVEPARMLGEGWFSPPFEFEQDCLDWLIDFIDGTSEKVRVIEPLTLQLVCQRAEEIAKARAERGEERPRLRREDFGGVAGLERLVQNYFANELNKLAPHTRKKAREVFEYGLLDPYGKRLMLEQGEVERDYGLDKATMNALVDSRLLRREPRNESDFYEISHDRLAETIAKNRKTKLPPWVRPTIAIGVALIIAAALVALYLNKSRERAEEAKTRTEDALVLLLGDDLVARLREAGLSDALQQVLDEVKIDESSQSRALALKLRHEGDILRERGTIKEAQQKLTQSLTVLDSVIARSDKKDFGLMSDRARTLASLGAVLSESGQVSQAHSHYVQSVQIWDEVLKGTTDQEAILRAAEARSALGDIRRRMGDWKGAESDFSESLHLSRKVLTTAYENQSRDRDVYFLLGHAMQIYADAALNLANLWVWGSPEETKAEAEGSIALAREALRLRPLSFNARIQIGVASANSTTAILGASSEFPVDLFRESKQAFDELAQFDPNNLRLQRERAALRVMRSDGVATCAAKPDCKATLGKGVLEDAEIETLGAIGDFRMLAGNDADNRSLQADIAWGLQTRASLVSTVASAAAAIPILDEALAIRRKSIVDPQDIENRLAVIYLLHHKARLLEQSGKLREALSTVDESLTEVDRLPSALTSTMLARFHTLDARSELLKQLGRNAEAEQVVKANTELYEKLDQQSPQGKQRALAAIERGAELEGKAASLIGPAELQALRGAREQYDLAIKEYPFDPRSWTLLRDANGKIRNAIVRLEPQAAKEHATEREAALRGAFAAAWMTTVLSPKATAAGSRHGLHLSRTALAVYLYASDDPKQKEEALMLSVQGALDGEEQTRLYPDSDLDRFYVADAHLGVSMLRSQLGKAGWEEALRTAIAYADRNAKLKPRESEHKRRVGSFRYRLASRLTDAKRNEAAANEFRLSLRDCREAMRLAKTDAEKTAAQSCLDDLATRGYK